MYKILKSAAIVSVCVFAAACASTEPVTETPVNEPHYQPIHIKAGKSIASDSKNANYDENKTTTTVARVPVMPELKEEPALKSSVKIVSAPAPKVIIKPIAKAAPTVNYQIANILFADGGADIDAKYNSKIAEIAALAKKHNALITVYGFASSRTKDTDVQTHKNINFKVSLQRAQSVAAALRRAGVKKENIIIEALSDSYPLYSEVMPEGERLNRRAEVYISY